MTHCPTQECLDSFLITTIRVLTEFNPQPLRQCFEDFLVGGVDLFCFQRAGGLAVLKAVGDGLAGGGDFLAAGVGEKTLSWISGMVIFISFLSL